MVTLEGGGGAPGIEQVRAKDVVKHFIMYREALHSAQNKGLAPKLNSVEMEKPSILHLGLQVLVCIL